MEYLKQNVKDERANVKDFDVKLVLTSKRLVETQHHLKELGHQKEVVTCGASRVNFWGMAVINGFHLHKRVHKDLLH